MILSHNHARIEIVDAPERQRDVRGFGCSRAHRAFQRDARRVKFISGRDQRRRISRHVSCRRLCVTDAFFLRFTAAAGLAKAQASPEAAISTYPFSIS